MTLLILQLIEENMTAFPNCFLKLKGERFAFRVDPGSIVHAQDGKTLSFTRIAKDGSHEDFEMVNRDCVEYIRQTTGEEIDTNEAV